MAYIYIPEAAEKSGINQATIHGHINNGNVPHKLDKAGRKMVQLKDVKALKNKVKQRPRKNSVVHPENKGRDLQMVRYAAITLGIDKSTIYKWVKDRVVQRFTKPNDHRTYVDVNECKRILDSNGDDRQQKIVFVQPKDDQRYTSKSTADRVNDLELLYYDLLDRVDGLQKAYQQRAIAEPAIDWFIIPRGTRVVDAATGDKGMLLGMLEDDETVAWVMYDDETRPQHRLVKYLKLEEND